MEVKYCSDKNLYCNSTVVPLADFCEVYFGPLCNFPCGKDQCEKTILEFTDCTGSSIFSKGLLCVLFWFLNKQNREGYAFLKI